MATKKKQYKSKKQTFRFLVLGLSCIFIISAVLTSVTKVWINIFEKYKEKKELENEILALKQKEEELTVDVERLQDPEYIGRYLREKYFYTKDGEYVIRIPD